MQFVFAQTPSGAAATPDSGRRSGERRTEEAGVTGEEVWKRSEKDGVQHVCKGRHGGGGQEEGAERVDVRPERSVESSTVICIAQSDLPACGGASRNATRHE